MSRDEEQLVLRQFLRFGETRAIAHDMVVQDTRERHVSLTLTPAASSSSPASATGGGQSDIKKFIAHSSSSNLDPSPGSGSRSPASVLASPSSAGLMRAYDLRHFLSRASLPYATAAAAAMATGRMPSPASLFTAPPLLPITTAGGVASRHSHSQPFDYSPPGLLVGERLFSINQLAMLQLIN